MITIFLSCVAELVCFFTLHEVLPCCKCRENPSLHGTTSQKLICLTIFLLLKNTFESILSNLCGDVKIL